MSTYVARHAERAVETALSDTRVVVVNGARQSGKSTMVASAIETYRDVQVRRLGRPSELQSAREDPERFVAHTGLLVIDELQRAPELVLPIKARVDGSNRPGQFLLTGSARLLGLRTLPDALVGRTETVELWPFSQGEIERAPDAFVDAVFASPVLALSDGENSRDDYVLRATRGGFPEAVRREDGRRRRWFESYVTDLIDRDVVQLSEIQRRADLGRLIRLLAKRMATPLATENVAKALDVPKTTIERYIALFEEVFLLKRIPAWSNSATSRATRQRKLLFVDTGLAAHLDGRSIARLQKDASLVGSLLENFVLGELARQITWSTEFVKLHHFRVDVDDEIDAVLECSDGRIVGIEVKSGTTVNGDDFRHLRKLQRKVPDLFWQGIVLYTGSQVLPFGDRLTAMPIDALWRAS